MQQEDTLLDTAARGFLVAFLVGSDRVDGIFLGKIDVADGIVDLIKIVDVLLRPRHALQPRDHLLGMPASHHLGHGDARIELQFVGRIGAHHSTERLIGLLVVAEGRLHLSQEEQFARFLLLAHLLLDDFLQIGNGLLQPSGVEIVVGVGVVPLFHCAPVHRVAVHLADDILGIVDPVELYIALGQPRAGSAVDGGLRLIEACHVGERGSSLVEGALMELRAPHEHPRFPQERVVLLAVEPFDVALCLLAALLPFGPFLDAVLLDGLLTLLDGPVEVGRAQVFRVFVAHRVEGEHLGEVVLVALLLGQRAVDIGQRTIIIGIITGGERMPPASLRRILLGRTRTNHHRDRE